MSYTTQQLANLHGVSLSTMYAYIKELRINKEFKKTSPGVFYSDREARQLSDLIGFDLPAIYVDTGQSPSDRSR